MSDLAAYLWVVAGVIVAVLLPVLLEAVRKEFGTTAGVWPPPWLKRYFLLLLMSLFVALVSLALWRSQNPTGALTWPTAFLLGFGWESALEKAFRPKI